MDVKKLHNLSIKVRSDVVRMVNRGGSSHIGAILSIVDILVFLYGFAMRFDPKDANYKERDRFILSKGHAGAGVYSILAECGFFNIKDLEMHCQNGSIYSGHVSHKGIPGVEFSTGSLGHGLPVACGMAYAAKIHKDNHRVFCLMGYGEIVEGSNWEALLFAAHHNLNNLTILIDRNKLQSMKSTEDTVKLEPLIDKFMAFGMEVYNIDGHLFNDMKESIAAKPHAYKPRVVICNTVKGKGVSFMENRVEWHYKTPTGSQFDQAIIEIESESYEE